MKRSTRSTPEQEPEREDSDTGMIPIPESGSENDLPEGIPPLPPERPPGPQEDEASEAFACFMSNRVVSEDSHKWKQGRGKNFAAKKRREQAGKELNFNRSEDDVQAGLLKSRAAEWEKWMKFNAATVVMGAELEELIKSGQQLLPMRWVETDKNEPKRVPGGPKLEPIYKSRLVARGDLEKADVRSDSPTADVEAQNLVFSFAASNKLPVKTGDITNAYFQGKMLMRLLVFRQPKGGLPGVPEGACLVARVPVYGTRDAGRGFWKTLRDALVGSGLQENRTLPALYSYSKDGEVLAMLATHVDDLLWAAKPEAEHVIAEARKAFIWGKEESRNFVYCGKCVRQDADFNVHVSCRDTTLKTKPISIAHGRKLQDNVTEGERTQLRSIAGSLAWVARQVRPDLSYRVSQMQSVVCRAKVRDLKDANKVLEYAIRTADRGLTFRADAIDWNTCVMLVISDASHAQETEGREEHRSQGGRVIALGSPEAIEGGECRLHVLSFTSKILKRVVRSTFQAEAYSLQAGVEEGDRMRAAFVSAKGLLSKDWEASAAANMRQIWYTDCKSLEATLVKEAIGTKYEDKRLNIELASLRQSLWRAPGETVGNPAYVDHMPKDATDVIRWIDTDVMLADPLTKSMEADKLNEALDVNRWSFEQPVESVLKKRAKQLARRKTPVEKPAVAAPPRLPWNRETATDIASDEIDLR
jgi:hypothetical protein